jgi:small subunit ribosomal protein S2
LASELLQELIDAGIHFGHRASRWNPKMRPYIFGKRNLIHIIDVKQTLKGILLAKRFLAQVVASGKDVLLIGTKRQAKKTVEENALRVGMHFVNDRWLGGTLTNFREIRRRIGRLDQLEALEAEGQLDTYSKKQGAALRREVRKIRRNLQGIRRMERMPGAMVIIDQRREIIAIREANKMGIPVVALLDTDGDPDMVDIPIPGNDDAMRSIELVVRQLCDAMAEGAHVRQEQAAAQAQEEAPRRRSRRLATSQAFDADDKPVVPQAPAEPAAVEPAPVQEANQ